VGSIGEEPGELATTRRCVARSPDGCDHGCGRVRAGGGATTWSRESNRAGVRMRVFFDITGNGAAVSKVGCSAGFPVWWRALS